jgi:hypothetical protein
MCECHQIGGRFIAEDPECPVHGYAAVREREEQYRTEQTMQDEIDELRERIATLEQIIALR